MVAVREQGTSLQPPSLSVLQPGSHTNSKWKARRDWDLQPGKWCPSEEPLSPLAPLGGIPCPCAGCLESLGPHSLPSASPGLWPCPAPGPAPKPIPHPSLG
nr:anther-specific proline-rich protein APG-like [Equus caballus]